MKPFYQTAIESGDPMKVLAAELARPAPQVYITGVIDPEGVLQGEAVDPHTGQRILFFSENRWRRINDFVHFYTGNPLEMNVVRNDYEGLEIAVLFAGKVGVTTLTLTPHPSVP